MKVGRFPNKFAKDAVRAAVRRMAESYKLPGVTLRDGRYTNPEAYLRVYCQFATALHRRMKEFGFPEGVFTIAESRNAKRWIERMANAITVAEILAIGDDRLELAYEQKKFPT